MLCQYDVGLAVWNCSHWCFRDTGTSTVTNYQSSWVKEVLWCHPRYWLLCSGFDHWSLNLSILEMSISLSHTIPKTYVYKKKISCYVLLRSELIYTKKFSLDKHVACPLVQKLESGTRLSLRFLYSESWRVNNHLTRLHIVWQLLLQVVHDCVAVDDRVKFQRVDWNIHRNQQIYRICRRHNRNKLSS